MKIIDLSLPIDDSAFEVHDLRIDRVSHKDGVEKLNKVLMSRNPQDKSRYESYFCLYSLIWSFLMRDTGRFHYDGCGYLCSL